MTFLEMYTSRLDIELGSSQTTLFTVARRKQALNDAMKVWCRVTGCSKRYGNRIMSDGVGEYDLEASFTDYIRRAGDPSIKIVDSDDNERWIQGNDSFPKKHPEEMDRLQPGWRAADPGSPTFWYMRDDGGYSFLGVNPAPEIATGEVWTLVVPYVARPTTMVASTDKPFVIDGNEIKRLEEYQQALIHYAAALLEPLRKNWAGAQQQKQLFAGYVAQYETQGVRDGADQVTFVRNYLNDVSPVNADPRRWP